MSRRLPLLAPPSSALFAPAPARRPLTVDLRCTTLVCVPGLDACAAWLATFRARYHELAGPAVPAGLCTSAAPLSDTARALARALTPLAPAELASAFPGAPHWLLVTDAGFAPSGARCVVNLCDPVGARSVADDFARHVHLSRDRHATARALAEALVASAAPRA